MVSYSFHSRLWPGAVGLRVFACAAYALQSKLLKGGCIGGGYIGEYYRRDLWDTKSLD